ncbi:TetR/AcrR family transcriptional regulator [Roseovarius azorensis]|nr:TetR family transcriptional regulator C-terminal domain-containing protein [Roseovarius azorensis]
MNETVTRPEPESGKSRRTESREVRRGQLIAATIDSIARYGIGGTTMSTVTEAAGLSIGLVNFHFKSKQNLLEETLTFLAREHHEQWRRAYEDAGLSAPEKLLAIVASHFHPRICTRRKLAVWYAFFGEGKRRAVYRALVDDLDRERYDLSTQLCAEIEEEGGYGGLPPHVIARTLEALYDGIWLNILIYPDRYKRDQAHRQVRAYLASVYPRHFEMPGV